MRFSLVAVLGFVAYAYAEEAAEAAEAAVAAEGVYKGPVAFPPGIGRPPIGKFPKFGPPEGAKKLNPIWHPPHKGVPIDDCDDDGAPDWHWAHGKGGHKPIPPHFKWTVSTVTATNVVTVTECPDDSPACPGKGHIKTKTITVDETTTICPVPITEDQPPKTLPPKPTKSWAPPHPEKPEKPEKPEHPGKPEKPEKPEHPEKPPHPGKPDYPKPPPATSAPPTPPKPTAPVPSRPVVTAGAAQNAQMAGAALVAVAAAAAALV